MSFRTYVCPHDPNLLAMLHGRTMVLRVREAEKIPAAVADVHNSGNAVQCIIVESAQPLDSLGLQQRWFTTVPVAIYAPSMGQFRKCAEWLKWLRKLPVQLWFPCEPENITSIRIFASLGVKCGVVFGDSEPPWESLGDLMTYSIIGQVPHAPIEPFESIKSHFKPSGCFDWKAVYFDDPAKCVHLDGQGHVALSRCELLNQEFVGSIGDPDIETAIEARHSAWEPMSYDRNRCSCCRAWCICLGKFARSKTCSDGCANFVLEMMDDIERSLIPR